MFTELSNQMADAVASIGPSVVQVQGRARPASGLVYAEDIVITMVRNVGQDDRVRVRRDGGDWSDAELVGWDPTTHIAVLRSGGLAAPPVRRSSLEPRVGHLALAVARSWSNAVTASAGIVSVIGGPLPTGRRRAIDSVIRTSAPMHEGFTGGAFADTTGALLGLTTAASIRGLRVVIPAPIVWQAAAAILEHGSTKRGYLGIAAQAVSVSEEQSGIAGRTEALLVIAVKKDTPAAATGLLVGDLVLALDDHALSSPDDLLELLVGERVGKTVTLTLRRGNAPLDVRVTVADRGASNAP